MKLVMDEKLKHRLIGLAVIISLGAIFAPAVMRKSNQRIEDNFNVNVQLPPKPNTPNVAVTDEKEMFKTIKVSRVEIPPVSEDKQVAELVKAEPLKSDQMVDVEETLMAKAQVEPSHKTTSLALNEAATHSAKKAVQIAATAPTKKPVQVAMRPKAAPKVAPKAVAKVVAKAPVRMAKAVVKSKVRQEVFAVQLASFSQLSNAQALVSRLNSKGYKANYTKIMGRQGPVYKVYAGHSPRKYEVQRTKSQLANALQLNGFVVNTGVS